jgi:gamma-glutamylcyclotransferase (GGCT)/AIG2-like uncharacterized protein YtfP
MHALLAVYGTLRRGGRLHHHLGTAARRSRHVGTAKVRGTLHEVEPVERDATVIDTSYPCLTLDPHGLVVVELYELLDPDLLADLDDLEGYLPDDLDACEYHRVRVPLVEVAPRSAPHLDAWTYVYVRTEPDPARHIAGGDWIRHLAAGHPRRTNDT